MQEKSKQLNLEALRTKVIAVLEHRTLDETAAFELIDGYYKDLRRADMETVIGEDVEVYYKTCPLGFKCDGFTCKYNHSEMDRIYNEHRAEQRKRMEERLNA